MNNTIFRKDVDNLTFLILMRGRLYVTLKLITLKEGELNVKIRYFKQYESLLVELLESGYTMEQFIKGLDRTPSPVDVKYGKFFN